MSLPGIKIYTSVPCEYFVSIEGNLYSKDGKTLVKYANGKKDQEFKIKNGVEIIDSYAIDNNESLKKITISKQLNNIKNNGIYECPNIEYTKYFDGYYIGTIDNPYYMLLSYSNDEALEAYVHSDTKIIYKEAFRGYSNLKKVHLPINLKIIGDYAFSSCKGLEEIDLPFGLEKVGMYAFSECVSLYTISMPNTISEIGNYVFNNCTRLSTVKLSEILSTIPNYAFYGCTNLQSIVIPNSVKEIGNSAFSQCISLKTVNLSMTLEKIGNNTFSNCSSLENIYIPKTVLNIGRYAFSKCVKLYIFCEASSQPSNWNSQWNPNRRLVVWDVLNNSKG